MKLGRDTVDAFAHEILHLIRRLRPVLEGSPTSWPDARGRLAASIARDLTTAVEALDVAVEELYFQTENLEAAYQALEIERLSYQELFEGGPDGYLVTDPGGMILRANRKAGELFACAADDLVGELLPALVQAEDRPSLQAAIVAFELQDRDTEWIGQAVSATGASSPWRWRLPWSATPIARYIGCAGPSAISAAGPDPTELQDPTGSVRFWRKACRACRST